MENEFFVTSVKEKCTYFDITSKETFSTSSAIDTNGVVCDYHRVNPRIDHKQTAPGFIEKIPGRKSVKIKLESAGAYDIDLLNAAMASGKKVKITIVE